MSEVKVNKVTPRSGTTLTIGDSGDTTNVVGTLQNNGAALVGDISSVVAGTGLSGGGTSGAVTLNSDLLAKQGGTNFTNSLLIGHATTGTLNAANENVGIGTTALDALTSGDSNVAIGMYAGTNINQGSDNTLVGHSTGGAITSTSKNTFIGAAAGASSNSGHRNTALGHFSGQNITSASGCVFIGSSMTADSQTDNRQLKIGGNDGSTTTTWISGDSNGNLVTPGTITANSVVLTGVAADDSITLAKMASGTDGNIISYDTSGNPVAVATGSSGQVLTSAGSGAVPSFQSPAGGGKILQVVNVTKTSRFTTTTALGSFADVTGMSVAITPSASSSKILVLLNCILGQANNGYGSGCRLLRDSTAVYIGDSFGNNTRMIAGQPTLTSQSYQVGIQYLDSPNTTNSTTYKLQAASESGGTAVVGSSGGNNVYFATGASSITLMEIGA